MTVLKALVNLISQSYPAPCSIAQLSYQSTSAPSRLFAKTKLPNFLPHITGSQQQVVGNSVAPKALTIILIPASLQTFFIPSWTSLSVFPQGFLSPKYMEMFCQTRATSSGLLLQLQKAKIMWLQSCGVAQPGSPRLAATFMPYQQIILSMQTALTGQLVFFLACTSAYLYSNLKEQASAKRSTMSRICFIMIKLLMNSHQFG